MLPLADGTVEASECAICLQAPPFLSTPLLTTHCGHKFCEMCISTYVGKNRTKPQVACPLCRADLTDEDMPSSVTLTLPRVSGMPLGVQLKSGPEDAHAIFTAIAPGSSAEKAGLRVGMHLLAIDDVTIGVDDGGTTLAARLRGSGDGASVRLKLGVPKPPTAADVAAAEAARRAALPVEGESALGYAAYLCCCSVTGQIYARALRRPRCLRTAAFLWSCFLAFVAADVLGDIFAGGYGYRRRHARTRTHTHAAADAHSPTPDRATWRPLRRARAQQDDGRLSQRHQPRAHEARLRAVHLAAHLPGRDRADRPSGGRAQHPRRALVGALGAGRVAGPPALLVHRRDAPQAVSRPDRARRARHVADGHGAGAGLRLGRGLRRPPLVRPVRQLLLPGLSAAEGASEGGGR